MQFSAKAAPKPPRPFFIWHGERRLFALLHEPAANAGLRGSFVYIHPFAEEMNKSRRAAALAAAQLAANGWGVLAIDLFGCGDSGGDFSDATWSAWIDDTVRAHGWLARETGTVPDLWGLRSGALLAAAALAYLPSTLTLALCQPVLSGRMVLNQFLRTRVAADALAGSARVTSKALREQLMHGHMIDVAGYQLAPELALPLERAAFTLPEPYSGTLVWLEVDSSAEPRLAPASLARIDELRAKGLKVSAHAILGQPFWQTQEIEECMSLGPALSNMLLDRNA